MVIDNDMAIQQGDDEALRELALFAGAGGGILGGHLLGWRTICAVERDAYAAQVLAQRQNDGILRPFPIWSDVTTFDGRPWRGRVGVVSGGFPCQDISVAGKGKGVAGGARSGLWSHQARIIREVEPIFAYMENSPALTIRGLGIILGDLAAMGFYAQWGVLSCEEVGGVHLRERIWILATNTEKLLSDGSSNHQQYGECQESKLGNRNREVDTSDTRGERGERSFKEQVFRFTRFPWGEDVRGIEDLRNRPDLPQPIIRRINNDVAFGVDRLKAIGNGQVPLCAAVAWNLLKNF